MGKIFLFDIKATTVAGSREEALGRGNVKIQSTGAKGIIKRGFRQA